MGPVEYPTYKTVLEHYGFIKDPFGEAVDPDLFYPAASHVKVLDSLTTGLREGISLQAITSEPGVGKTTILKLLHERVNTSDAIFHRQPKLRRWESLKYLLLRLGISCDSEDMKKLQQQFVEALEKKRRAGVSVYLIIDEAQNLGKQVLALLQSLSSSQSNHAIPLRVVLAVQATSLATLRESGWNHEQVLELKPLKPEEVGLYIAHRLRRSGSAEEIFTPDAVHQIAEYSRGVPREINGVCSEALRLCLESGGSRTVDEGCLKHTIALRSSSYEVDATTEPTMIELSPVLADHGASLLGDLEHWFAKHDHPWSGTRSELLTELQAHTASSDWSAGRREDLDRLLNVLEQSLPELEKSGVGLVIKKKIGSPVLITLQHIDPLAQTKIAGAMVDTGPSRKEENKTVNEQEDQSSSQTLDASSERFAGQIAPQDAATLEGENNSTESIRRAFQTYTGGHEEGVAHRRRTKLLLILLILTLLSLTFIWARQRFSVRETQEGSRGLRGTLDRATESREGSSSVSKLMRGAESGDAASQLALATLYQSGDRVERNDEQALQWLRKAAAQGEAEAAYRLANAYRTGQGVPVSKVDAYCWYVIAANSNHPDSDQQIRALTAQLTDRDIANVRYELGQMYLNGTGTRPDKSAAFFWFRLAEVAGHPTAMNAKQSLASRMTVEEKMAATEKASKWLQVHPPRSTSTDLSHSAGSPK